MWKKTRELYERLHAADWVAKIISNFEFYDDKEKVEAKEYIEKMVDGYGVKTIISHLPFSLCRFNFILPTPDKERTLQKFFPQLPIEIIHEWLNEGAKIALTINEEKLEDLSRKIGNMEE